MPRKSSVKRLPPEILAEISRLIESERTIDEIMGKLHELDIESVSRSALGRYVKEVNQIGERMRRSRVIADALIERLGDAPESRQARLNIELAHSMIMNLVGGAEDGLAVTLDPEQVMLISRAIKDLSTAQKTDAALTIGLRKQLAAEAEAKLKAMESKGASEGGIKRGFDPDTLRRVREEIYGIPAA